MKVLESDGTLTVERPTDRGEHRALHGLTRSLIANMVEGVTEGFEKRLEIQGVGYRARLQGKALELAVGYSHPVSVTAPGGDRVRGPAADPGRGPGDRQAAGRRDRRADPPHPPARALQGQGHPLRGRARPPQGREAGVGDDRSTTEASSRRLRRRRRVRAKVRGTAERPRLSVFRSNRGIFAQLIDDDAARTVAAVAGPSRSCGS